MVLLFYNKNPEFISCTGKRNCPLFVKISCALTLSQTGFLHLLHNNLRSFKAFSSRIHGQFKTLDPQSINISYYKTSPSSKHFSSYCQLIIYFHQMFDWF